MPDTAVDPVTIDSFGLTDVGKMRQSNEDNFLIVVIRKSVDVRHSSLPPALLPEKFGATDGYLFVVADGVGGRPDGDVASERTVTALLEYVGQTAGCFREFSAPKEHELFGRLEETVQGVHKQLTTEYGGRRAKVPATTLTMVLLVWPRAYLIHVGDSRAYVRRHGRLQRLTRDQTMGEYMVTVGAWTEEQAAASKPGATLSSAIGGTELTPVVGLVDLDPGDSIVLCTDGLTKHVSDERIGAVLAQPADAEAMTRQLIDEALANGGTDNVTVIVVRSVPGA
jgi:serine/threonine protein phosphatase PrpC